MTDAFIQYEHEETGVVACWHGGEYIDLGYFDADGDFQSWDVINVWDHAKDQPRIPRTLAALEAEVNDHLNEQE